MLTIPITPDMLNLDKILPLKTIGKAAVRMLNKVAKQALVAGSKEVRSRYTFFRAKDIRDDTRVSKATWGRPRAAIVASGKHRGLIHFKAKWSRKKAGASVMVTKGKRVVIPGTFIATAKTAQNVWRREGKARLPIVRKVGPSVPQLIGSKRTKAAMQKRISAQAPKLLDHELTREVNKLARRAAR